MFENAWNKILFGTTFFKFVKVWSLRILRNFSSNSSFKAFNLTWKEEIYNVIVQKAQKTLHHWIDTFQSQRKVVLVANATPKKHPPSLVFILCVELSHLSLLMWYLNIVPLQHYKMRNAPLNSQTFLLWSLLLESSVFISSFTAFLCLESKSNEMKGSFLENKLSIGIIGWLELNKVCYEVKVILRWVLSIFFMRSQIYQWQRGNPKELQQLLQ